MPSTWTFLGWQYRHQGQLRGMISTEALARLCAAGAVGPHDHVWKIYLVNGRRQILQTRADLALGLESSGADAAAPRPTKGARRSQRARRRRGTRMRQSRALPTRVAPSAAAAPPP